MGLEPGTTLGHYDILSTVGVGGMGEVYRAKDKRLGREVAIKVLLEEVSTDPKRMARFEREARVLASLNHNNIASLHAFERDGDTNFLVMELVEGETLADRISRGRIPVDEAIPLFRAIADGLEAAHAQGVVHRDLKPANIKLGSTETGTPLKILDFGLAKALDKAEESDATLSQAPTVTLAATMDGQILGTPGYMSPEQVRGEAVDHRADIWAFGVCLLEALTGRAPFLGENLSSTLASVLRDAPPVDRLPPDTPVPLQRLLARCLAKPPAERLHHIADARLDLDDALRAPVVEAESAGRPRRHSAIILAAAVAVAVVVGVAAGFLIRGGGETAGADRLLTHVSVALPPGALLFEGPGTNVTLSPDGRALVFGAYGGGEDSDGLYYRRLSESTASALPGSKGGRAPTFSPDGKWVAFFADDELKKVAVGGGLPVFVQRVAGSASGVAWAPDDTLIYADRGGFPLARVPSEGGEPVALTVLAPDHIDHRWPALSPDGRVLLYTAWRGALESALLVAHSLETGESKVITTGTQGRIAPGGFLIFARRDSLWAVRFEPDRLETVGSEVPISEEVAVMGAGAAHYDIGADGSLVFAPTLAGLNLQLMKITRNGSRSAIPWLESRDWFSSVRVSPDGRRLAVGRGNPGAPDLWVYDIERGSGSRLDTSSFAGVWSPDGRQLAYAGGLGADQEKIWVATADVSAEPKLLLGGDERKVPSSWSPDGRFILFNQPGLESRSDIMVLDVEDGTTSTFLSSPSEEREGVFSPDGRWVAYTTDETGQREVFVRPFQGPGAKHEVSIGGGRFPIWSRHRDVLHYLGDSGLMEASVGRGSEGIRIGRPKLLFEEGAYTPVGGFVQGVFDECPDGECFFFVTRDDAQIPLRLVQGWAWQLPGLVDAGDGLP